MLLRLSWLKWFLFYPFYFVSVTNIPSLRTKETAVLWNYVSATFFFGCGDRNKVEFLQWHFPPCRLISRHQGYRWHFTLHTNNRSEAGASIDNFHFPWLSKTCCVSPQLSRTTRNWAIAKIHVAVVRNRTSNVCSVAGPDGNVASRTMITQTSSVKSWASALKFCLYNVGFEQLYKRWSFSQKGGGRGNYQRGGYETRFRMSWQETW